MPKPPASAQCWTPPYGNSNAPDLPDGQITLHLVLSEPMNKPIATGHHVPGKIPGTSGMEAWVLREKQEAWKPAGLSSTSWVKAGLVKAATFTANHVKLWHKSTAVLTLNVQGLANLGKKVNNSLRKSNRKKKKRSAVKLNSKDFP